MKYIYKPYFLLYILALATQQLAAQQVPQNFNLSTGMRFEENKGQIADTEGKVRNDILFVMKDKGMNLYFTKQGIHYQWYYLEELMEGPYRISEATGLPMNEDGSTTPSPLERGKGGEVKPTRLHTYRVDMQWQNANADVEIIAEGAYEDYNNYYHAHCPDGIHHVKSYAKLTYKNLYPGIDVIYYAKEGKLKYDVELAAGADLQALQFSYTGATPQLENGKIKLYTPLGFLEEQEPISWDEHGNTVNITYSHKAGKLGFDGPALQEKLIIDPDLIWGTYYGGGNIDNGHSISTDSEGSVYLAGSTQSLSSIASGGHQNTFNAGTWDAFVVKFSNLGIRLWGTYYGGSGWDKGFGVASDAFGNVYLAGETTSTNAISSGGHQNTYGEGMEAFLVKFNNNGVRQWGTYYGGLGEDHGRSVTTDASGNIYLTGRTSSSNAIASGGHQNIIGGGFSDAFLVKFNNNGVRQWGTYYGGSDLDVGTGVAVDVIGNVYLTGYTSSNSTIALGGHQNTIGGGSDAFLVKFNSSGTRLWGTYYGGINNENEANIAIDTNDNVYLIGQTASNSAIASGGHQNTFGGGMDAFLVKFNSIGTRLWATYYGGVGNDFGFGVTTDIYENVYLAGYTSSTSAIAFNGFQNSIGGGNDTFIVKFNNNGQRQWGTYFGGGFTEIVDGNCIATDTFGNAYLVGTTQSSLSFDAGHQNTFGGASDAFLVKFSDAPSTPAIASFSPQSGPVGTSVTITGTNFNTTPANNIVFFGATRADVTTSSETELIVSVPAGATFQPISVLVNGLQAYSKQPFIVSFPGQPDIVAGTFAPKTDFATGSLSQSVASGDFDGDGKADIVVSQQADHSIGIFRNTSSAVGNINFAAGINISTDDFTSPNSVATADFDGDGKLDIVVAKQFGDDVSVFRNTSAGPGSINFAPKLDFATAETPFWLAVGDFDGDGKPDIAVANATSNSVSILRNTSSGPGNISFAAKVDFTTGNEPRAVAVGDLDGDGKPDLALACTASNVLSVLRNTSTGAGNIGFATKLDYTVEQAYSVAIGDLNGNGNADIAVVSYFPNEVSLFRYNGIGAGNISYAARVILPTSNNAVNVAIADLDGDGKLDMAIANQSFESVAVYRNTNAGTSAISFAARVDYGTAQNPSAVAIVDLDNDGKNDLAVSSQFSLLSVLRNNGDVTPPLITSLSPEDDATNVLANTNLVITFNEPVQKGSGNIIVREEGDVKEIIDVSSGSVSIEGNIATIVPQPFTAAAEANIEFAPGVFRDMNNNEHGGLVDPTAWNFTIISGAAEPGAQPTNLNFTDVTNSSFTVNFDAADPVPNGYIAIRREGASPTSDPADGTAYTVGASLGDGIIAYVGTATNFEQSGLSASTTYHYKIYSYNGTGTATNYRQTSPLTGSQATSAGLASEPTAQPSSLSFTGVTSTSITINFNAASPAPDGYIAIRREGAAPETDPADGTSYNVGATLGNASVAYVGSANTFTESGLAPGTTYHYKIYSYNGSGSSINYLQNNPIIASQSTATENTGQAADIDTSLDFGSGANGPILTFDKQTDNKLLVGGDFSQFAGIVSNNIDRLLVTGAVDLADFDPGSGTNDWVRSVIALPDGKILAAGDFTTFNNANVNYLVRLNANGSIDNTFNQSPGANDWIRSMSRQSDGKIIIGGDFTTYNGITSNYIDRINADGTLDLSTFNPGDGANNFVYTTALQTDGRILIGGIFTAYDNVTRNGIARLNTDGSLDTGFNPGTGVNAAIYSISIQADGKIIIAGDFSTYNGVSRSGVARLNADGSLDTGFNPGTGATASVYTSTLQSDGKIILGGLFAFFNGLSRNGIVRLNTNGSVDTSFDPQGGFDDYVHFVRWENDMVWATGAFTSYRGTPRGGIVRIFAPAEVPLTAEPAAQATNLNFTNVTSTSLTVNFTAAAPAADGYIAIRRAGAAPTTDPADGTAYTVGTSLGDGTIAFVGSATSFEQSGLSASTTYHYKIYTYNGTGAATNYRQASPLTGSQATSAGLAAEPAAQPTNLSFASVTASSFTVNFTAASPAPDGYIAIRREGAAPTTDPADGTAYTAGASLGDGTIAFVGTTTSFEQSGLSASTTYHYKIYSYNGTGSATNYRQASPLTGSQATSAAADTSPPVFGTNSTPASVAAGSSISVSVNITDAESGINNAAISFGPANSLNFSTSNTAMSNTSGNTWTFSIPATAQSELGVRYRITATNGAGLENTLGPLTVAITQSGTGLNIPFNSFGTAVSNYRIIAVPLNLQNKSVNAVFGPAFGGDYGDREKWRMYHYNNGTTSELTGSSQIDLGKGYWLISRNNVNLSSGAGQTSGSIDNPHSINLNNGWNQVGNPYNFNLLWSDVVTANAGVNMGALRLFNGSFANGTRLDAFQGGFIFVNSGSSLIYPASKNPSVNGRFDDAFEDEPVLRNSIDTEAWEVRFSLTSGELINNLAGLGMHPEAEIDFDRFDDFTLPRMPEFIELNHNKRLHNTAYARDMVPSTLQHSWDFEVNSSNTNALTSLSWENAYFKNKHQHLVLWDEDLKRSIDMSQQSDYTFVAPRKFRVLYGNAAYIQEQTAQYELILHEPYPNPASGSINFSFVIPQQFGETLISFDLIDQTGRKARDISKNIYEPGFHQLSWETKDEQGKQLRNGLYLLRITAGDRTYYKKILIIQQ